MQLVQALRATDDGCYRLFRRSRFSLNSRADLALQHHAALPSSLSLFAAVSSCFAQTARVVVTNDGAIPTRFTIEDVACDNTPPRRQSAKQSHPVTLQSTLPQASFLNNNTTGKDEQAEEEEPAPPRTPTSPHPGDNDSPRHHHPEGGPPQRGEGQNDDPSCSSQANSLPTTEGELLARAGAVGNAALRHEEEHAAIEVHAVGGAGAGAGGGVARGRLGGEVGAYESSEIAVAFAPLSVREFRGVKVRGRVVFGRSIAVLSVFG